MGFFSRGGGDTSFPKSDRGSGSLDDYKYDLLPKSTSTKIRLAGSDPHQEALRTALELGGEVETVGVRRTAEEERTDAPMAIRLFAGGRVTGVVGTVPRGLEPAIEEALTRLENAGRKLRIPAEIVSTKQGLRVDLLLGRTR